ncbi:hypothetical protein Ahy_A04g018588 [Arachis hypogaea]|uniref:Replication protein A 70 kDa DNA-binding subunit B/D first OB fold domain-containing protein n=1 Tax=Arachis hypogaea TaxID=3818 RepID=A0A445DE18_ARAHY|nr:hypothetical protein Ahy_A04g018588 [Arachis hypogaea]
MPPPSDRISKLHPPREVWRLRVRVLRLWVVHSFENHDVPNSMEMILVDENGTKVQATVKKHLINRFKEHIIECHVYRMSYFSIVENVGSYRATDHEYKLVFLNRTVVINVSDDNIIAKTCVIDLLISVGEEKEYFKDDKIVKMIVVKLASKEYVYIRLFSF